jgi:hypothetical protein
MIHAVTSKQYHYIIADLEIFTAYDVSIPRREIDVKTVSKESSDYASLDLRSQYGLTYA